MSRLADRVRELASGDAYRQGELAYALYDSALATVEALERAVREHVSWCACGGCAVLRSWEQALGLGEEQSDGRPPA